MVHDREMLLRGFLAQVCLVWLLTETDDNNGNLLNIKESAEDELCVRGARLNSGSETFRRLLFVVVLGLVWVA